MYRYIITIIVSVLLATCGWISAGQPVMALSAEEFFKISYSATFSQREVRPGERFSVTVTGRAYCEEDLEAPYDWATEVKITGFITAVHSLTGVKVTLNSRYELLLSPVPTKAGESIQETVTVDLCFPPDAKPGTYIVSGELDKAEALVIIWMNVKSYLPQIKTFGSITCLPLATQPPVVTTDPSPAGTTQPAVEGSPESTVAPSTPAITRTQLPTTPTESPVTQTPAEIETDAPETSEFPAVATAVSGGITPPSSGQSTSAGQRWLWVGLGIVWLAVAVTAFFTFRKPHSRPRSPETRIQS